ncbi:MAG: sugar phosphate nucleotidyltransferase [bacterium]|nr:sugar phosphate nucleotidyltransferase [bacterium]
MNLSKLDVVILCGGLGTRFREVDSQIPKVMASVIGRPFLDRVVELFLNQGCQRFIFCTGYKSEVIEEYLRSPRYGAQTEVIISKEMQVLGTAGAIKHAEPYIHSEPFLVVNGDSYCKIDLAMFVKFHTQNNAYVSIALTPADMRKDAGGVSIDEHTSEVTTFEEKVRRKNIYNNAGIYLFSKGSILQYGSVQSLSLEYDVFPKLIRHGLYGFVVHSPVIDIGTPERYYGAPTYFKTLNV